MCNESHIAPYTVIELPMKTYFTNEDCHCASEVTLQHTGQIYWCQTLMEDKHKETRSVYNSWNVLCEDSNS